VVHATIGLDVDRAAHLACSAAESMEDSAHMATSPCKEEKKLPKAGLRAMCSASVSCLFFNDSSQTNYLKTYQTDLRQIFGVGTTAGVDNQS